LSGQTDLWATLNTIALDLSRKNPQRETELKFKLRNSPAHMAVRQGDFELLRWLDTYIFFIKGNGELDRLHKTWLGEGMGDVPVL
jgi:polar amino acid transport system substrate-binding protein